MALCRNVREGGRERQRGGERSELYYHTPDHAARAGAGWSWMHMAGFYKSTSHERPSAPLLWWSFKPTLMQVFFFSSWNDVICWVIFSFLWGLILWFGQCLREDIFNKVWAWFPMYVRLFWTGMFEALPPLQNQERRQREVLRADWLRSSCL